MKRIILIVAFVMAVTLTVSSQTSIDFSTIPSSGTILIYAHADDDFIWMLPWWPKVQKFISGVMPSTPVYDRTIDDQQIYLDMHYPSIDFKSKWKRTWTDISHLEYVRYYWDKNYTYNYLSNDHLKPTSDTSLTSNQINKIKAKIEAYIADPATQRIITHNNWGEYNNQQHMALNQAVRELAVKYGKDVWMLNNDTGSLEWSRPVPEGMTYTLGNYDATLYGALRQNYVSHGVWTYTTYIPSGNRVYVKIVDGGVDKSGVLLPGTVVTTTGVAQGKPGAYIFNGTSDYLTLTGNNYPVFSIGMWVRPTELREMDIAKMSEYPLSGSNRCFVMQSNGHITAKISDGTIKTITSTTALKKKVWAHVLMTFDGGLLRLYIDGDLEGTVVAGPVTGYVSPEFVIGQAQETASFFDGQVADVRLYDYALTGAEITSLVGNNPPAVYSLTAMANVGGTISPQGTVSNNAGTSRTYSIAANPFYVLSDVKVDNVSVGAVTQYTFSNLSADHAIAATFSPIPSIALNKPATSLSFEQWGSLIFSPNKANDTDQSDTIYWSAYPYPQWWQVDLQEVYDLSGAIVRTLCEVNRYYQYEIWASMDNINFTKVAEKKNATPPTDAGDTYTFSTRARYLKLIMTYNSNDQGVHVTDFRAFGTRTPLVWNGAYNNDWNNASNWMPAAKPVATSNVTIPNAGISNFPTLTAAGTCNDLTLESGATLLGGGFLLVNGTVSVKQELTSGRNWYIASSVSGATSSVVAASSQKPLYFYDEPHGSTLPWPVITNQTTPLEVMKGYVANIANPATVVFTGGDLNSGTKQIALTRTQGQTKEGFNLVGNPYPAYVNWNLVDKSDLSTTTMWYRTFDGSSYKFYTYNPVTGSGGIGVPNVVTNLIPPLQAFWVRAKQGGGVLSLSEVMCAHRDYPANALRVARKADSSIGIVRFEVSNVVNSDETVIYFNPVASDGLDELDSPKMSNGNAAVPEIYTLSGNEQLVINGMSDIRYETEIPLGFRTGRKDVFTLRVSQQANLPDNVCVILRDKELNAEVDLSMGMPYTFTSDVASTTGRFSIIFRQVGTVTSLGSLTNGSEITIVRRGENAYSVVYDGQSPEGIAFSVCTPAGQRIFSTKLTGRVTDINVALVPGVYLVVAGDRLHEVVKKIVIK